MSTIDNFHIERITVPDISACKQSKKKITALTAYDYTMALLLDRAGVDLILVGDSVASVVQGHETTLPVAYEEMLYHCRCVTRAVERALVVADLPFMSYQVSPEQGCESAGMLLKKGAAAAVKLEGGVNMYATIKKIVSIDIPVLGHIGLTPQSYHRMGGYRVQGKAVNQPGRQVSGSTAAAVLDDALAVQEAGCFAVVLEGLPADLAASITAKLTIPTIGIGAGPSCDGQILVAHDMLGLSISRKPKFVKQYCNLAALIEKAPRLFIKEVQQGKFPDDQHSYRA